jgi:hypothetical protein
MCTVVCDVACGDSVADRAVLVLAASLREAELIFTAERLERAYDREARIVALDFPDREAIMLEDCPAEPAELRATLLEHALAAARRSPTGWWQVRLSGAAKRGGPVGSAPSRFPCRTVATGERYRHGAWSSARHPRCRRRAEPSCLPRGRTTTNRRRHWQTTRSAA